MFQKHLLQLFSYDTNSTHEIPAKSSPHPNDHPGSTTMMDLAGTSLSVSKLGIVGSASSAASKASAFSPVIGGSLLSVDDLQISTANPSVGMLIFAVLYGLLFIVGICGNSTIFFLLCRIVRLNGKQGPAKDLDAGIVQMLALSITDFIMMLSLPLTISDMLLNYWAFGNVICKVYWLMESTGKIMSTFVLTFMSFDRYMQICHPASITMRSSKPTLYIILILGLVSLVILSPLPYFAQETPISFTKELSGQEASTLGFATPKCMLEDRNSHKLLRIFTWNIFALGFLIPLCLIAFFYTRILMKIRQHQRKSLVRSQFSLMRVSVHTLAIVLFYFICWCPYWVGVLYANHRGPTFDLTSDIDAAYVHMMYGIHALPFLNSSFNWVFYAMLNQQLRRKRDSLTQQRSQSERRISVFSEFRQGASLKRFSPSASSARRWRSIRRENTVIGEAVGGANDSISSSVWSANSCISPLRAELIRKKRSECVL